MESFYNTQCEYLMQGKQSMIENIKILLYQEHESIFDLIDFEDDTIYLEPLLFAYFKSSKRNKNDLFSILYGYIPLNKRPDLIELTTDEWGRIYLPKIGWLITNNPSQHLKLKFEADSGFNLLQNDRKIDFLYEPIQLIGDTSIELLKYPVPILEQFYYDVNQTSVKVEITKITLKQLHNLELAIAFIKDSLPHHYDLISSVTKGVVVFNIDYYLTNSFATLSAQGIAFLNSYQDDYNEVFFIDDIAHQSGHVIFNTLIYDSEEFLLVEPGTVIQILNLEGLPREPRDIHVVFHALYTYYTTFICLDAYLQNKNIEAAKRHEALGRMRFYIKKCYQDISIIESPDKQYNNTDVLYSKSELFTEKGFIIYQEILKTYNDMVNKWYKNTNDFDLSNQPYNFTYSSFIELNPIS